MTWQKKHDIVLIWIDSCVTVAQLENMVSYVNRVSYENRSLLFWIRMKCYQLQANIIFESVTKIRTILK